MIQATVNKIVFLACNFVLDAGLVATILAVNSIDDLAVIIKIGTSLFVSGISAVRLAYFIKEKKNSKNDKDSTK